MQTPLNPPTPERSSGENVDLSPLPSPADIFGERILGWGNKHPQSLLSDIWKKDRQYLLWAAGLQPDRPCASPPPLAVRVRIKIAHALAEGRESEARALLAEFAHWEKIVETGEGLDGLPRPSRTEAQEIVSRCSVLGCHQDLDGIMSGAALIRYGGALGGTGAPGQFSKLRLLRYGYRDVAEYAQALGATPDDTVVVVDFAACPGVSLTLDHHATCLSYWELSTPLPCGIYDPTKPSCPQLLVDHCGLPIPVEVTAGCNLVDGAQYQSVRQTSDLSNPFVALEAAMSVDSSEPILKKVLLTLADNHLDPESVLREPIWRARLKLLALEIEEQRNYWSRPGRFNFDSEALAIADARLAPYSASRFRYLPFEVAGTESRPYLLTVRPSKAPCVNLGLARNPFFADREYYTRLPMNLGALLRAVAKGGGGRIEAASANIKTDELPAVVHTLCKALEQCQLPTS